MTPMTIQELTATPEFQDLLKSEIAKQAPSEFKFEFHKGDIRTANTGEFLIDDDLKTELAEVEKNIHSGSFTGTGTFEGNYIDSGNDSEHYPQTLDGKLRGSATLKLQNSLFLPSASDILSGATLDVEVDEWP